jgi:tRNA(fMet)-specific endonuclease VapC
MSLYVLDTDILSLYQHGHAQVVQQVTAHPLTELAITVITVEEQLSGWYTVLRKAKKPDELAAAYQRLAATIPLLARFPILTFDEPAILEYEQLAALKLKVRKMDLRIAAIVRKTGAILVTRNTQDFLPIPGLVTANWTL